MSREDLPLAKMRLPTLPAPTITFYADQVRRFNDAYNVLLQFAADVTGKDAREMNMVDMERWRAEHGLPVRDAIIAHWFALAEAGDFWQDES